MHGKTKVMRINNTDKIMATEIQVENFRYTGMILT